MDKNGRIKGLKKSSSIYELLFNSTNDAIFLMRDREFVDCNPTTLEMFECKRDDIIGHDPIEYSPEKQPNGRRSRELAEEIIDKAMKGVPQRFEWVHKKKNGDVFDAEVSLNKMTFEGVSYLLAIVRDISQRKEAERELQERVDELEKLTRFMVNREVKMVELKDTIEEFKKKNNNKD